MKLSEGAIAEANTMLEDLFAGLEARGNGAGGESLREVALDMRYAGQEHTLTVAVPSTDGAISVDFEAVHRQFTRDYQRTFDLTMDETVEIVNVRATLRTPLPRRAEEHLAQASGRDGKAGGADPGWLKSAVPAFSFTRGERLPFNVLDRSRLAAGDSFAGPVIVIEETATTYIDAGFVARVDPSGCLFISEVD